MLHRVVTPFPYSWDGVTSIPLAVGEVKDFGSSANGLVGMGWIEAVDAKATVAEAIIETTVVEVPPIEMTVVDEAPIEMAVVTRGRKRK